MQKKSFRHLIITGFAALLSVSSAHATPLIANGSFETPLVPVGSFSNFATGSTAITNWTVFGPAVSVVSGAFTSGAFSFPAQDGNQWLDLTGPSSGPIEGVEQTVATTPLQNYDLSFYVGNVAGGVFGTASTVGVLINGSLIGTATNGTPGTTLNWQPFTFFFTATSSSTVIGFENLDPSNDDSNGLDNVSLALASSPPVGVPEPASMLLLGTGLIGVGARRLRNRRQRS